MPHHGYIAQRRHATSSESPPKVHLKSTGRSGIGAVLVGTAARSGAGETSPVKAVVRLRVDRALNPVSGKITLWHPSAFSLPNCHTFLLPLFGVGTCVPFCHYPLQQA